MSYMIVCCHDITRIHEGRYHMQITSGMFTKSVDHLDNSLRFASRNIDPSLDLVTSVVGRKRYFV